MSLQLSAVLPRLVIRSPHSAGIDQIIEANFVCYQVTISDKLIRILMSGFRRFFKLSIPRKLASLAAKFLEGSNMF